MGGGSQLPGYPHPTPLASYWQTPPADIANHRSTSSLPPSSEYVIIGTGITGTSIATKLLSTNPSAQITLLEARTVCSGATGRNGGHCSAGFWDRFKDDVDELGVEEALKIEKWELENVRNVGAWVRKGGFECDLEEVERVDCWKREDGGKQQGGKWREMVECLRVREEAMVKEGARMEEGKEGTGKSGRKERDEEGEEFEWIGGKKVYYGEAASRHMKMPDLAGAVVYRGFTLVTEMMRRLLAQGVNLQTTTPVISIFPYKSAPSTSQSSLSSAPHRWTIHTDRGSINTSHVILATNAYTSALLPSLATTKFLIPTRAQVCAIRPGSLIGTDRAIHRALGPNGWGQGDYMLQRPLSPSTSGAGDVIYGGGRRLSPTGEQWTWDDSVLNEEIAAYLRGAPIKFFGKENWGQQGSTIMEWTGIMGYTKDGRPMIGEVEKGNGFWVCAGFNGHGMALTFQAAQALVEMVEGGREPVWFPKSFRLGRVMKK